MHTLYNKGLLSILVPCFNGAKYLSYFLDSVYLQTDTAFQIIITDDGSTDDTADIIEMYRHRMETKGILYTHLHQENKGQSAAINTCFSEIKGEFVCWVDADDRLDSRFVERKRNSLCQNENVDVLISKAFIYNEHDNIVVGKLGDNTLVSNYFEDVIFSYRNLSPGLFATRTSFLMGRLDYKPIIESRVGQNLQLVLPILYNSRIYLLDEYLYHYYIHPDSHSRTFNNGIEWKKRFDDIDRLKIDILNNINMDADYRQRLIAMINKQTVFGRITKIDKDIEQCNPDYVKEICMQYCNCLDINYSMMSRRVFLWGIGRMSVVFHDYIEKYTDIQIDGYIESNPLKQVSRYFDKPIIKPSEINKKDMFIIIPLARDKSIIDTLRSSGFENRVDFVYPKNDFFMMVKGSSDGKK